jgi:transposase
MLPATTRPDSSTPGLGPVPTVYLAFDLGNREWTLGFTTGFGQPPRERTIAARDLAALAAELTLAKRRFALPAEAPVRSCYEAGRDGFWLHRALAAQGVANVVVDSASIEINRRARRAKSDRLDVRKLLTMLLRYAAGERRVWHVVHVPTPAEEDRRQLHRELLTTKRDRTRLTNRIKGLLAGQGVVLATLQDLAARLPVLRTWDGAPLAPALGTRLEREWAKVEALRAQIRALEAARRDLLRTATDPAVAQVRQLLALRAIGPASAWLYVMEFFSWRQFANRREVGALAGLTPTPYQSGDQHREQGIAKAGNRHIRAMAIEIAWAWLRLQPTSALSRWYQERFGHGSSRVRRIGIVALARKLLIELWRYLETGVIPEGAVLKAWRRGRTRQTAVGASSPLLPPGSARNRALDGVAPNGLRRRPRAHRGLGDRWPAGHRHG